MSNKKITTDKKISSGQCRKGCGACCIAPSISSSIPGMPKGKPAEVVCIHLDENNLCKIFGFPARPQVCNDFSYNIDICGQNKEEALINLRKLEQQTSV